MDYIEQLRALRDAARARVEEAKRALEESQDGRMAASLDILIAELEGLPATPAKALVEERLHPSSPAEGSPWGRAAAQGAASSMRSEAPPVSEPEAMKTSPAAGAIPGVTVKVFDGTGNPISEGDAGFALMNEMVSEVEQAIQESAEAAREDSSSSAPDPEEEEMTALAEEADEEGPILDVASYEARLAAERAAAQQAGETEESPPLEESEDAGKSDEPRETSPQLRRTSVSYIRHEDSTGDPSW